MPDKQSGAELIRAERERQVFQEGWDAAHDDGYSCAELLYAAACYVANVQFERGPREALPATWPWERHWWKPADEVRTLVKAGALIAAEIDRLQRQRNAG